MAERACLRLIPWAPQRHESIVQESLSRVLCKLRADKLDSDNTDLAAYVYGVTRICILQSKTAAYREEIRQCALPDDEGLWASLLKAEGSDADGDAPAWPEDQIPRRLLCVLRYYVVHSFTNSTKNKRRQALRDTFILARHYLRGVPLLEIARELGLTRRACQYAMDRTLHDLMRLFDLQTGEVRSFVENSGHFFDTSELSDFLRDLVDRPCT